MVEGTSVVCKTIPLQAQTRLARKKSHRRVVFPQHCTDSICLWLLARGLHKQHVCTGQCAVRQVIARPAPFHPPPVFSYIMCACTCPLTHPFMPPAQHSSPSPCVTRLGYLHISQFTTHPNLTTSVNCEAVRSNK